MLLVRHASTDASQEGRNLGQSSDPPLFGVGSGLAERLGVLLALSPPPGSLGSSGKTGSAMAGPTGFEPAISSVTGWHVGPLHHGPAGATVAEYSRGAGEP